jgi:hypothetical protein
MAFGPGKYGANAEKLIREHGGSLCVILLVGNRGPGFDVATTDPLLLTMLPDLLRVTADEIEAELANGKALQVNGRSDA